MMQHASDDAIEAYMDLTTIEALSHTIRVHQVSSHCLLTIRHVQSARYA